MKSTFFSKRIGIAVLVAAALVIASLATYGEVIDYKATQSIETEQSVHSYSFRSNRTILLHLTNGYVIHLDLSSVPLNVQLGNKNTLHRFPGHFSKYGTANDHGYVLTLTPKEYKSFNQDFLNNYGEAGMFIHKKQEASELVYISL
ncbi:hypothetical protein [Sporolactobacillus nakayamae]|uniref:Uncharacterized protein n=1 Tax=Sporolactobacillus nakayamae TaxID=269670 RepID=A0A1I2QBQ3_9BACL|nr:hypothetical protein [Sporolactobacillus nakayamae]SFG25764.1 hypothetical protein SAMN02982927_01137 [Sporolactobacillus nakayamae]